MTDQCLKRREIFVDKDTLVGLIDNLDRQLLLPSQGDEEQQSKGPVAAERLVESFRTTVDYYQEQPELLDPHLSDLIQRLVTDLSNRSETNSLHYHTTFKLLYQLIKVTGFKSIGRKFPHETDKLPLIVKLLSREDPADKSNWQTRFVLTVWLSIVILAPFDLSRFDEQPASNEDKPARLQDRIYSSLLNFLCLHDSCQQVTAYCLARFLSRPDVLKSGQLVDQFVSECLVELDNVEAGRVASMADVKLIGYLRCLAYMFEFVPRAQMRPRCQSILEKTLNQDIQKLNREMVSHLLVKVTQRAGLALLPLRLASWRHKRTARLLGKATDASSANQEGQLQNDLDENQEESESIDQLEAILNVLFGAAQNGQSRIRWSGAKGIARLASRLSRERASDVIDMVLANFFQSDMSNEFAWHGGCLILAEMSRNGLILEEKLADCLQLVGQAIGYDKIKGSSPVGSHVREAACYICWAMARTYQDQLLQPHVGFLKLKLLCTILFDRELHCRRAGSAALQELEGRQGTHESRDIETLQQLDYQNVGRTQFTYLTLPCEVIRAAHEPEQYARTFLDFLIFKKVGHWDNQIRRLAGQAMGPLMLYVEHDYVRDHILDTLTGFIEQNTDNNLKHGAILALSNVIQALVPLQFKFGEQHVDLIARLPKLCEKQLKSKQQAGPFTEAIARTIAAAEQAKFVYSSQTVESWETLAFNALDSDHADVRQLGAEALVVLYRTYYVGDKTSQDRILNRLNKGLASANESSRCGSLQGLGSLGQVESIRGPATTDQVNTDAETAELILMSLVSYVGRPTYEESLDCVYATAKAQACESLVEFLRYLDPIKLTLSSNYLQAGYDALLTNTEDYTFDKRGDIGVQVRRAALRALADLCIYLRGLASLWGHLSEHLFNEERVEATMGRLLQQTVSYNNSAREQAGQIFHKLVCGILPSEKIPHYEEITQLLAKYGVENEAVQFNWRDQSTPIFVALLGKREYALDLWQGLLPSVGQMSELFGRQFREALAEYLRSLSERQPTEELEFVFESLLTILNAPRDAQQQAQQLMDGKQMQIQQQRQQQQQIQQQRQQQQQSKLDERLFNYGLVVVDYLLTESLMDGTSTSYRRRLMELLWDRSGGQQPADPKRLISASRTLSLMLQFTGSIRYRALELCVKLLSSGWARVRVCAADHLYQSMLTHLSCYDEDEDMDQNEPEEDDCELGKSKSLHLRPQDIEDVIELLRTTIWNEPLEKIRPIREQISGKLGLP